MKHFTLTLLSLIAATNAFASHNMCQLNDNEIISTLNSINSASSCQAFLMGPCQSLVNELYLKHSKNPSSSRIDDAQKVSYNNFFSAFSHHANSDYSCNATTGDCVETFDAGCAAYQPETEGETHVWTRVKQDLAQVLMALNHANGVPTMNGRHMDHFSGYICHYHCDNIHLDACLDRPKDLYTSSACQLA